MSYHKSVPDAIAAWDSGQTVWTVEMGGLGPGYEQALQICMVEILREAQRRNPNHATWDQDAFKVMRDDVVHRIDNDMLGLSGAQVSAATVLAWQFFHHGWDDVMSQVDNGRRIMISRGWPKPPEVANGHS